MKRENFKSSESKLQMHIPFQGVLTALAEPAAPLAHLLAQKLLEVDFALGLAHLFAQMLLEVDFALGLVAGEQDLLHRSLYFLNRIKAIE